MTSIEFIPPMEETDGTKTGLVSDCVRRSLCFARSLEFSETFPRRCPHGLRVPRPPPLRGSPRRSRSRVRPPAGRLGNRDLANAPSRLTARMGLRGVCGHEHSPFLAV